jgi:hypothetical protein
MLLETGEVIHHRYRVEADGSGRSAFLFVTSRRIVIEYTGEPEPAHLLRGFPVDGGASHATDLRWKQVGDVALVPRPAGPALLQLSGTDGDVSLWKSPEAGDLARDILAAKRSSTRD